MKSKDKTINQAIDKEKCINFFIRYGYYVHEEDNNPLIMRKPGTQFTTKGDRFPKELYVFFKENETKISLRYDADILFDTGDLQKELNLIENRITANMDKLLKDSH